MNVIPKKKKNQNSTGKTERKKKYKIKMKMRFKMAINTYLSITILSVNGLNALIKRQSGRLD